MKKFLLLVLGVAGLSVANAKSYSIEVHEPAVVGGMTLEPGEYKVEVIEQKAVITMGRVRGEAPVKLENGESKYNSTTVRYSMADGKMRIQEIRLGGTKTKLIFSE